MELGARGGAGAGAGGLHLAVVRVHRRDLAVVDVAHVPEVVVAHVLAGVRLELRGHHAAAALEHLLVRALVFQVAVDEAAARGADAALRVDAAWAGGRAVTTPHALSFDMGSAILMCVYKLSFTHPTRGCVQGNPRRVKNVMAVQPLAVRNGGRPSSSTRPRANCWRGRSSSC